MSTGIARKPTRQDGRRAERCHKRSHTELSDEALLRTSFQAILIPLTGTPSKQEGRGAFGTKRGMVPSVVVLVIDGGRGRKG